jgi:ABC-type oligopeptide transport system substrate-binding subunit
MRMKTRWMGGLLVAMALALAACAPPDPGGQQSSEPSAPRSEVPAESQAVESLAPSESAGTESEAPSPTPYDY